MVNNLDPNIPSDFSGYNTSGSSIPAFSAVRIAGAAAHPDRLDSFPTISLARANLSDDMPCAGITTAEIENGQVGTVRTFGIITDVDTSAFAAGDLLYVSGSVAGGLVASNNPPNDIMQVVASVLVSDATVGSVFVFINPMMDGHVSYTNRDQFTIANPSGPDADLLLQGTGGLTTVTASPTGSRVITLPDATTTLVGRDTTDVLANKTFPDLDLRIQSSGDPAFAMVLRNNETLTADRRMAFILGNVNRSLTMAGDATISGTHSGTSSGTNTGDQTISLTGDVTGSGAGSLAATIANDAVTMAKLANGAVGHTLKGGASDPAYVAAGILFRREFQYITDPGVATATRIGLLTAPTMSGTTSNQDTATRPLIRHVSGAVSGDSAGVLSGFDVARPGWNPKIAFVYQPGSTITLGRWWCGMSSADLAAVATPTTQHVAAFGYDTARDGTAFWRTVTCDGTTATVTATAVPFAASTTYNLRVEENGATNVLFYIDDVLVNTHTTNLPAAIQGFQMRVTTLTSAARRFEWSRVGGEAI